MLYPDNFPLNSDSVIRQLRRGNPPFEISIANDLHLPFEVFSPTERFITVQASQ